MTGGSSGRWTGRAQALSREGASVHSWRESGFRADPQRGFSQPGQPDPGGARFRGKSERWRLGSLVILSGPQENILVPEKSEGRSAFLRFYVCIASLTTSSQLISSKHLKALGGMN